MYLNKVETIPECDFLCGGDIQHVGLKSFYCFGKEMHFDRHFKIKDALLRKSDNYYIGFED